MASGLTLHSPAEANDSAAFENGGEVCQACGACCAYASTWPRFTLETDAELDRLPAALVNAAQSGMACSGNRCLALAGEVGKSAHCTIYAIRPQVCRSCMPGDDACHIARAHFRLYELPRLATPSSVR